MRLICTKTLWRQKTHLRIYEFDSVMIQIEDAQVAGVCECLSRKCLYPVLSEVEHFQFQ